MAVTSENEMDSSRKMQTTETDDSETVHILSEPTWKLDW